MRGEIPVTPPGSGRIKKVDPEVSNYRSEKLLDVRGETAVIHVDGAIDKNLGWMDRISFSATDLMDVDRAIARAGADPKIYNVMFAFDSPGGTVPGVPETAARIAALGKVKNVAAYLDNGCSAAYWLAAMCSEIYAAPSSSSGSIGVYLAVLDESRALELLGIRIETLQDGNLKTAGAPWKPLSESEKKYLQDRTDQIGEMFRSAITSARPRVDAAAMEGQAFLGAAALEAGLIDSLCGSLDEAIARAF
jgi:signal peptide peptidase SppA